MLRVGLYEKGLMLERVEKILQNVCWMQNMDREIIRQDPLQISIRLKSGGIARLWIHKKSSGREIFS